MPKKASSRSSTPIKNRKVVDKYNDSSDESFRSNSSSEKRSKRTSSKERLIASSKELEYFGSRLQNEQLQAEQQIYSGQLAQMRRILLLWSADIVDGLIGRLLLVVLNETMTILFSTYLPKTFDVYSKFHDNRLYYSTEYIEMERMYPFTLLIPAAPDMSGRFILHLNFNKTLANELMCRCRKFFITFDLLTIIAIHMIAVVSPGKNLLGLVTVYTNGREFSFIEKVGRTLLVTTLFCITAFIILMICFLVAKLFGLFDLAPFLFYASLIPSSLQVFYGFNDQSLVDLILKTKVVQRKS